MSKLTQKPPKTKEKSTGGGKKPREDVTLDEFKTAIQGDEDVYNKVVLIKDQLESCQSLEEQVMLLIREVFPIYSNRGDAPNINCFEQLFTNCLESRRVHSIYTRLKKKEDDILKGTYVPSKGKGMKRNKLQQKSMKTWILMSVCLLMMITTLKLMI